MSRTVNNPRIIESINLTDVSGLIDPDTGNIEPGLLPAVTGTAVYANQAARLAGGASVGTLAYQQDTGAYWMLVSSPASTLANWVAYTTFASSTVTNGGAANGGLLLALDANGKAAGRVLETDGAKLDGIASGAAALTSSTPAALGVAAVGVATVAARGDHVHAMPSAADVGAATAAQGAKADAIEGAPILTTTATSALSAESNLGALTTGLVKISVSAGVATPSTAVAGTDYQQALVPTVVTATPYTYAAGTKPMFAPSGGAVTWNLPAASTAQRYFFHVDSGTLTMDLDGTDTFIGSATNPTFVANEGGEISTSGNGNWRFD